MRPRTRNAAVIGSVLGAVFLVLGLAWFLTGPRSTPGALESAPSRSAEMNDEVGPIGGRRSVPSEVGGLELADGPDGGVEPSEVAIGELAPLPKRQAEPGPDWDSIHGIIIDEHTRERVPEISVCLTGVELDQRLKTNDDGEFRSLLTGPPKKLHVTLHDGGERITSHALDCTFGPHRLRIPIGPTYPIALKSDDELADTGWEARIVESRFVYGAPKTLEVLEYRLRALVARRPASQAKVAHDVRTRRGGMDISDREWSWIPLRTSEKGHWVRYSRVEFEPDPHRVPRLEIRNRTAGLEGRVPLEGTEGIQPRVNVEVGDVPPNRACHLSGNVHIPQNDAMSLLGPDSESLARVILLPSGDEISATGRPPVFEEKPVWDDGNYRFEHLPPGRRVLLAYAVGHKLERREIELAEGENILFSIELHPSEERAFKLLLLDEPRPRPRTSTRYKSLLRLRDAGAYARAWLVNDSGRSGPGQWITAHCGLPEAEFMHLGIGHDLLPIWLPHMAYLKPHEGPIRLELAEEWELVPHGFEVSSAVNEDSLGPFRVYFGPIGVHSATYETEAGTRWKLPGAPLLRYTIYAPGFAPACGTEADFREESGERIAKFRLEPGWGAVLYFRAGNPNTFFSDPGPWTRWNFPAATNRLGAVAAPPIPSVGVLVDGKLVGRTDKEGMVRIALPQRPPHIELDSPGWKLSGSQRLDDVFKVGEDLPHRHLIWMERE